MTGQYQPPSGREEEEMGQVVKPVERVTVVIPAKDRPDLLERCLDSMAKQDFPIAACEILVCDDHSRVDLGEVVERFRMKLPKIRLLPLKETRGPAAARNLGFRSSQASIFICVDSDVVCEPSFLGALVHGLESHQDWVAAEATVLPLGGPLSPLHDSPVGKGGAYVSGAVAYRAEMLHRVGGFDERFLLPACEDVEIAMRLIKLGKFAYVPEAVAYHPIRRITWSTHWRWRRHWKYETILAKRYGILAFPGHPAGRFPRLRVARAAVLTLPAGRFLEALRYMKRSPSDSGLAALFALFDVLCGLWALPTILFSKIPLFRDTLSSPDQEAGEDRTIRPSHDADQTVPVSAFPPGER